ncbi:MAG: hypothetical protein R6X35_03635 [Candidatus Krumholzibacteriia bacterium]
MPRPVSLPLLLCVLACAVPAAAADFVVGAHGGYGAYTQEDLNAAIRELNAAARADLADEIAGGFLYGGHAGLRINDSSILGVGYDRLLAKASGSAGGSFLDLEVPADCWYVFWQWLPDSDKVGRLGLGADAGFVTVSGGASSRVGVNPVETRSYEGDGLFLAVSVVGDAVLGSGFSLLGQGGFRLAQVPGITIDGLVSGDDLDYSGVFVRAGLRYAP